MGGNQINLFKYRHWDDSLSIDACNGHNRWGGYVEMLQDEWRGDRLTWHLTGYNYRNQHLEGTSYGR